MCAGCLARGVYGFLQAGTSPSLLLVSLPMVRELCRTPEDSVLLPQHVGRQLFHPQQLPPGLAHRQWPFQKAFPTQV